jgi:hypothetical protein
MNSFINRTGPVWNGRAMMPKAAVSSEEPVNMDAAPPIGRERLFAY